VAPSSISLTVLSTFFADRLSDFEISEIITDIGKWFI
jgi:hypothetical protein